MRSRTGWPGDDVRAHDFILLGHHPDLSRRPEPKAGIVDAGNRCAALTWNVFRTLELIAPAFWLRRFRARLDALTSVDAGGSSLSIRLWEVLPAAAGRRPQEPVRVDALMETEAAVYGVMTLAGADIDLGDSTLAQPDGILRLIDAVSWYAGARECYVVLVTSDWSDTPIGSALIERYRGSREVLLRRLPHRRDGLVNIRGMGRMTWRDLAGIIGDCGEIDALTDLERFVARRTGQWLSALGIHAARSPAAGAFVTTAADMG